jgi:hypothetical protein
LQHQLVVLKEKERMLEEKAHSGSGKQVLNLLNSGFEEMRLEDQEGVLEECLVTISMVNDRKNETLDEAAMDSHMMLLQ